MLVKKSDAICVSLGCVIIAALAGLYLALVAMTQDAWRAISWHAGMALVATIIVVAAFTVGYYWFYPGVAQLILYAVGGIASAAVGLLNAFVWCTLEDGNIALILVVLYLAFVGIALGWETHLEAKAELRAKTDCVNGIEF